MTSMEPLAGAAPDADTPARHGLATRLVHAGLAAAIIVQLASSQVMSADDGGDGFFALHSYSGLVAFGLVAAFWVQAALRRRGTPLGLLVPWFSGARLSALWGDLKATLAAVLRFRLPPHAQHMPLASAIHGLGLLLMTAMAASGTLYYFVSTGDPDAGGLVGAAMAVHLLCANLVWAYLIGHAGMALIAHYAGALPLAHMWSFKTRRSAAD